MEFLLEETTNSMSNLWFWGILLVGMALLFILPSIRNKRDAQNRQALTENFKVGAKIITYSGIYGTIVSMKETTDGKTVVLETGDDNHKSYLEVHENAIAALDKKEMVVLDANGLDITSQYHKEETEKNDVAEDLEKEKQEEQDLIEKEQKNKKASKNKDN